MTLTNQMLGIEDMCTPEEEPVIRTPLDIMRSRNSKYLSKSDFYDCDWDYMIAKTSKEGVEGLVNTYNNLARISAYDMNVHNITMDYTLECLIITLIRHKALSIEVEISKDSNTYMKYNDTVLEYKISIDKNTGKIRRRRAFAFIGDNIIEIDHAAFQDMLVSDYVKVRHDSLKFNYNQYKVISDHVKNAWRSGNHELNSYYNLLEDEFLSWKLEKSEVISW